MKKTSSILFMFLLAMFLLSCSRNHNDDVYFIHAVGFDGSEGNIKVHALIEKQSGDSKQEKKSSDYFVTTVASDKISRATEKLSSKYKDCYFATNELYIISGSASPYLITHMAHELSESNVYPSKSKIICSESHEVSDFLKAVKNEEDLKKLKKASKKHETNVIKFLTQFTSGRTSSLPALTFDSEGNILSKELSFFSNSKANT